MSELQLRGQVALAISGRLMAHPYKEGNELLPTNWLMWKEDGIHATLIATG